MLKDAVFQDKRGDQADTPNADSYVQGAFDCGLTHCFAMGVDIKDPTNAGVASKYMSVSEAPC